MELIGAVDAKRQKTLHITSEIENEVVVSTKRHPVIAFEQAEEEMAQIMALKLVNDADVVGDESAASAVDDSMGLKEKTSRSEALEQLQKAYGELTQLMALTENVNSQEHLVLLTKTVLGNSKNDDSTVMQRMALTQQRVMSVQEPLKREYQRLTELVKQRQAFSSSLDRLGRVWRLLIRSPKISLVGRKSKKAISAIGIDCSFGGNDTEALWVPLSIGEANEEGYAELPDLEKEREMKCLCLRAEHLPSKTILAHVTSWQAAKESVMKWGNSRGFEGHTIGDKYHAVIHTHCQQRQHESLSREVMDACKKEASTSSDRWIIKGSSEGMKEREGEKKDTTWSEGQVWEALASERISETLDVASLNRGHVELMLSEGIALTLSLQPLEPKDGGTVACCVESVEAKTLNTALTRALLQCEREYVAFLKRRRLARATTAKDEGEEKAGAGNGSSSSSAQKPADEKDEEPCPPLLRTMCDYIGRVGLLGEKYVK